jgi:hypothetical protein
MNINKRKRVKESLISFALVTVCKKSNSMSKVSQSLLFQSLKIKESLICQSQTINNEICNFFSGVVISLMC